MKLWIKDLERASRIFLIYLESRNTLRQINFQIKVYFYQRRKKKNSRQKTVRTIQKKFDNFLKDAQIISRQM